MSKDLALIPSNEELNVYQIMAKTASQSKLFEKIGGEYGLLAIMLMARELGMPPLQAVMGGMNIIQGKVEISPRLMNTMIRKAGHKLEILECSETSCKIKGTRHDTKEEYTCGFTIDEAKKAGLVRSGGGWEKYASDMLFARCLSRLARRLFADVISSAYVEGEISGAETEPLGSSEQLSRLQNDTDSKEEVVEILPPPEPSMTVEQFVNLLREKVGDKYSLLGMDNYLAKLEKDKGVSVLKIMEQALKAPLTERFCKGWQSWMNARLETDAELNEALGK